MEPTGILTYRKKFKKEKNLLYLSGRKKYLLQKEKTFYIFPKQYTLIFEEKSNFCSNY